MSSVMVILFIFREQYLLKMMWIIQKKKNKKVLIHACYF